jgi:hypothetical protein
MREIYFTRKKKSLSIYYQGELHMKLGELIVMLICHIQPTYEMFRASVIPSPIMRNALSFEKSHVKRGTHAPK